VVADVIAVEYAPERYFEQLQIGGALVSIRMSGTLKDIVTFICYPVVTPFDERKNC
jgi:hypothetical protein